MSLRQYLLCRSILCVILASVASFLTSESQILAEPQPASPPEYDFRVEQVWISMKDGVRLAANLYMPVGGKPGDKFPVLLESKPYRKGDLSLGWGESGDYEKQSYFARRGYVGVRLDIRGTGNSEGEVPHREYSEREQLDNVEVIAWLARQPWSNGNVGMFGHSWSGFSAIQVAGRQPPALKTIFALDATEDLFQDDTHYLDGLYTFDPDYELWIDVNTMMTPPPDYSLEEEILARRFEHPPWTLLYRKQQRDGPFWRDTSVVDRYDAIKIPVFMVTGWQDGYKDTLPRFMEKLNVPVKGIVGPWNHTQPNAGVEPRIEWRHEAVRWFDYWLKGRDTGVLDEPELAVFVQHWRPPDPNLEEMPGEWRFEETWPPKRLRTETLHLGSKHLLRPKESETAVHDLKYVPSTGASSGLFWWAELTPDQRETDGYSLVYDSEPLEEDTEILGLPRAVLHASASAPLANWFVRLSDVAPDGTVTLVTGAGLNGAQRESSSNPSALEPGKVYELDIELHFTSWVFPKGHRIRVAISNSVWPMIWPTPYSMTTSLHLGKAHPSRLLLPVMPYEKRPRPNFLRPQPSDKPPGVGPGPPVEARPPRMVHRDTHGRSTRVVLADSRSATLPHGQRVYEATYTYWVQDDHPEAASLNAEASVTWQLEDRVLVWKSIYDMTSDKDNFYYSLKRELYKDDALIREKTFKETIPRDHH